MDELDLPVFNKKGQWRSNPEGVLYGAMYYPKCQRSIELWATLYIAEGDLVLERKSQIAKLIAKDGHSRAMQGRVAGYVAGKLLTLKTAGLEVSMNKSVFLTLEFLRGVTIEGQPPSINSTSGVRKAFREFRTVAHFWSAANSFPEAFKRVEKSTKDLEFFLEICRSVGKQLKSLNHFEDVNLLEVPRTSLTGDYRVGYSIVSEELKLSLQNYNPELR